MLKKVLNKNIIYLLLVVTLSIGIFSTNSIVAKAYNKENIDKIILIDPGHGGMDGGAVSKKGTLEKDINLKISFKLRNQLEKKGFKVVMTREEDKGLHSESGKIRAKKVEDLNNRCKLKESTNCDVFISIHLNMFEQSKYYGAQVWYSKKGESSEFAHIIQENLKKDLDSNNNRKEKCADGAYKIFRCYDYIPSVLVECGFLSNLAEEEKLKTDSYQEEIAKSLAKSIEEFFIINEQKAKKIE